jgi:hypothetical protein
VWQVTKSLQVVEGWMRRYDYQSGSTSSIPIATQRTARELLVDALMRWRTTPWGGCVLLPVPDEIIAMVPAQDGPTATETLVACMQTEFLGVPLAVEADQPSYAWADAA